MPHAGSKRSPNRLFSSVHSYKVRSDVLSLGATACATTVRSAVSTVPAATRPLCYTLIGLTRLLQTLYSHSGSGSSCQAELHPGTMHHQKVTAQAQCSTHGHTTGVHPQARPIQQHCRHSNPHWQGWQYHVQAHIALEAITNCTMQHSKSSAAAHQQPLRHMQHWPLHKTTTTAVNDLLQQAWRVTLSGHLP